MQRIFIVIALTVALPALGGCDFLVAPLLIVGGLNTQAKIAHSNGPIELEGQVFDEQGRPLTNVQAAISTGITHPRPCFGIGYSKVERTEVLRDGCFHWWFDEVTDVHVTFSHAGFEPHGVSVSFTAGRLRAAREEVLEQQPSTLRCTQYRLPKPAKLTDLRLVLQSEQCSVGTAAATVSD